MARKILLADDSVTAQNMGRKILADAGYEVITVNNGSAALKRISEQRPDLIVLDVYMPGYSGLEVCQRLKETAETSRIPVLLTVGKLEPFKPEEAKRVRAEAFIVKPFEASELLSALSRLEDKVVPRAEPSKPGRFARAIAAVEHPNRDRIMAVEEDTGWKNRIALPSKKKKKQKEEEDEGEDTATWNAVNRDSRTVVPHEEPHKKTAKEDADKTAEFPVDVSAVAPAVIASDGLPKDVTAEEIAAIAAAAAQVQNAAAVSKENSEAAEKAVAREAPSAEQKGEEKVESATAREAVPPATFAEHKAEEKIEPAEAAAENTPVEEDQKDTPTIPGEAGMVAAMTGLGSEGGPSWNESGSGNGAGQAAVVPADVPVTMAAAPSSAGARWTAVPVAIDPTESAISLELEMQKAHAAAVAAETAGSSAGTIDREPASAEGFAAVATEPLARAATHEERELAHALITVASVAAEAVTAAVTELASMAASHVDTLTPAPAGDAASPREIPEESRPEAATRAAAEEVRAPEQHAPKPQAESPASAEAKTPLLPTEEVLPATPHEPQSAEQAAPVAEAPHEKESAAGGTGEMAEERESETTASSAPAWASWRQIRSEELKHEERASKKDYEEDEPGFASETAAMAAAAGAEKSPEGSPASDPSAIASIVDSVLADLRPKIVEEIAKKLGKK